MRGVGHIDAVPPVGLDGKVGNVAGLRVDAHLIEQVRKRRADPLGYVRPSFFTLDGSDLAALREALQIGEGKLRGAVDHALDGEAPVGEASGLQALELFARRRN